MIIRLKNPDEFNTDLIKQSLSQSALAKEAGVTQAYLNQVVNGKRNPGIKFCEKICNALNLEFDDLFIIDNGRKALKIGEDFYEFPYNFMPDIAAKIGLNKSIVIQFLIDWESNNRLEKVNNYNSDYWVVLEEKEWIKAFPFWNEDEIRGIFQELINEQLIHADGDRYRVNKEKLNNVCQ